MPRAWEVPLRSLLVFGNYRVHCLLFPLKRIDVSAYNNRKESFEEHDIGNQQRYITPNFLCPNVRL